MDALDKLGLSSNLEDYLETIYNLEVENRVARAKDIADQMSVSRASVTGALRALAEKKLINYEPYSLITLTANGKKMAKEIKRRHNVLKDFFSHFLRLNPDSAEANACRVEHAIDADAMERLVLFLDFLRTCPRTGEEWLRLFERFCQDGFDSEECRQCLNACTADSCEQLCNLEKAPPKA